MLIDKRLTIKYTILGKRYQSSDKLFELGLLGTLIL